MKPMYQSIDLAVNTPLLLLHDLPAHLPGRHPLSCRRLRHPDTELPAASIGRMTYHVRRQLESMPRWSGMLWQRNRFPRWVWARPLPAARKTRLQVVLVP